MLNQLRLIEDPASREADTRAVELFGHGYGIVRTEELMLKEGWTQPIVLKAIDFAIDERRRQNNRDQLDAFMALLIVIAIATPFLIIGKIIVDTLVGLLGVGLATSLIRLVWMIHAVQRTTPSKRSEK